MKTGGDAVWATRGWEGGTHQIPSHSPPKAAALSTAHFRLSDRRATRQCVSALEARGHFPPQSLRFLSCQEGE